MQKEKRRVFGLMILLLLSSCSIAKIVPIHVPKELGIGNVVHCSELMRSPLRTAFRCILRKDLQVYLRTYDGCYNYRLIAGTSRLSEHAYGLAIDLNARWNPVGKPPTIHPKVVACFEDAGFEWGGHWSVPDGMHFQIRKERIL